MADQPDSSVIAELKNIVGAAGWRDAAADLEPFLVEWRGLYRGKTPLVLLPATTGEVSAILAVCSQHGVAVVPQGGNTGLAGGAIPGLEGQLPQVVLATRRMNAVRSIDAANYTITVEAGSILADVQQAASDAGLYFPLSLAAEGSCQIGGNISTNAGGTNVLRFGNTRDLVLGLEVVLPDGSVLDELKALRKDNTGYDLKQLFIGAEGSLGVVTAATLKLFPAPASVATAWLAVDSPQAAVDLYASARSRVGDGMVAFELMPRIAIDMVLAHIDGARDPLADSAPWYVLLELFDSRPQVELDESLTTFLEAALEAEIVADGVVATSEAQRADLWRLRHSISEAQKLEGGSIKHDISVPVSRMPAFLAAADAAVAERLPGIRPVPFGHLGDGNLHYNLSQPVDMPREDFVGLWQELNDIVHSLAVEQDGSFSAEHGIGMLKTGELEKYSSGTKMRLLRAIKAAVDPAGIMNPGKVLR